LIADGLNDINFLVVNSGGWLSRLLSYELSNRVSFPVYEEGYFTSIWETLHGGKDDILVYDRCGFLTYHLRMPYSFLSYPYVESTIRVTYHGDGPCKCALTGKAEATAVAPSTVPSNETVQGNDTLIDEVGMSGLNINTTMNATDEGAMADRVSTTPAARGNHSDVEEDVQKDSLRKLVKHRRHHNKQHAREK